MKKAFILANIGLFVIAAILLRPTGASWLRARELARRQRQVYAAYSLQAGEYPFLHLAEPTNVLPYEYLAASLEDVQNLARHHGLETDAFTASGPVGYDLGGERFVEIRVQASFFGQYCQVGEFAYSLAGSAASVRSLSMDFLDEGMVNLRVEFSLFGREE